MDKKNLEGKASELFQKGKNIAGKVAETATSDETKQKVNKLKGQAQDAISKSATQAKSVANNVKEKAVSVPSTDSIELHNKVPAAILTVFLISFFLPAIRVFGSSASLSDMTNSSGLTLYYMLIAVSIGACLYGAGTKICRALVAAVVGVVIFLAVKNGYDAWQAAQEMARLWGNSRVKFNLGSVFGGLDFKMLAFGGYVAIASFLCLIPFVFKNYETRQPKVVVVSAEAEAEQEG